MNNEQKKVAQLCKEGAEYNKFDFPEIVKQLMDIGFERYFADFCTGTITYYLPSGESLVLNVSKEETAISENFSTEDMQQAIKEAQMKVPGYSYKVFCKKAMAAGCIGYLVSFSGKRVVYLGRKGDSHIEFFPN